MNAGRKTRFLTAALLLLLAAAACAPPPPGDADHRPATADEGLETLALLMHGYFSSRAQSEADSSYYDVRLRMIPIWPALAPEEHWLYVEQSIAGHEDAPYRQRLYRLTRADAGLYESAVFTLPDPERFVGASPAEFRNLSPEDVEPRTGCSAFLTRAGARSFRGGTRGEGCASDLRGARYAVSSVSLDEKGMTSWDRGFDAAGKQVWGAVKGGYVFDRLTPLPAKR